MIIHHMRIGEKPQQAHFSNPAEYKQDLALSDLHTERSYENALGPTAPISSK
jgi:hypothetical protein